MSTTSAHAPPTAEHPGPLDRLAEVMAAGDVPALVVGPGADMRYLCGHAAHPDPRPTLLVVRADGGHGLVVPRLEAANAAVASVPVVTYEEDQDPLDGVAALLDGADTDARWGVGDQLWATVLLRLQDRLPGVRWTAAGPLTAAVRMRKSAEEVDRLRTAGAAIDAVHAQLPAMLVAGRTEAAVAEDIGAAMRAQGHEEVAFAIVGSGPNGAAPHHEVSDRRLQAGDAVVVDIGGPVAGWYSDCTRNYVLGQAPEGYQDAHDALQRAQQAAVDAVRPGVRASDVDAAAREVLTAAGYGEAFIHRTGHGIGLEVHEAPSIVAGNDLVLEEGMTFSIEPGIYLEGRFGMRIEDIVAVTADGVERLNHAPREAVVVNP